MSTLLQINQRPQRLLRSELVPVDYVRYQKQFTAGTGDYTAERQVATPMDIGSIAERVAALKEAGFLPTPPNAKTIRK
ncbi:MAG: hypothetical protein V4675_04865 [Verrucomicrobiota bacterium]